jgi:putative ABC transport system permease protein
MIDENYQEPTGNNAISIEPVVFFNLGATVFQITGLITKDYMKLVVIAGMIALPLAFILLNNWLNDYAFRIDIGLWFFFLPAILIILIALITVSYQSVKAANANPTKNLRTE